MTRREVGFLIVGFGVGLLSSLAVVLEVVVSLRDGSKLSGFGFDKIILLVAGVLLLVGLTLIAHRRKSERMQD